MNKLLIEKTIIEKSNKNIQTGIKREFSDGINLICGNNEAGKSSLLAFIRQGFFKVKGVDSGKIYFKILNGAAISHYRTDIQDNRLTELRCKVFDENNNPVSYDFIKNTINQKYFEQGFTIDLDDLMKIQNNDTEILINAIKDPSGDKLSPILESVQAEAKKILGDNNRLTKDTSSILDKMKSCEMEIRELSALESKYNSIIQEINSLNSELENIIKQEEYLGILAKIKDLKNKLIDIEEQQNVILAVYNDNLLNKQEQYSKIIQNAGKIEANRAILQKNYAKLEQLRTKISLEFNRLQNEFNLNPKQEDIENFYIDYNVLRQLKEIETKRIELDKELIGIKQNKSNIEENLLRLKHDNSPLLSEKVQEGELEKLEELYSFIQEHLTKLNYLQSKISDFDKYQKINAIGIFNSKNLFIFFTVLFVITVITAIQCFSYKIAAAGIFAVLMAVFLLLGALAIGISGFSNFQNSEKQQALDEKESTLVELKERLKEFYSEIENIESSYLPFKIENLKTEIHNKIQNYKRINDILAKNTADYNFNCEKLNLVDNKIKEIQQEIETLDNKTKELICFNDKNIFIPPDIYSKVVDIIKNLKENITENSELLKDTQNIENENIKIIDEFNLFISETELKIPLGENYDENIRILKSFNDKNIGFKNNIDMLTVHIESIIKQIDDLEIQKDELKENTYNNITEEELSLLKNEKLNRKKEIEFEKRELEKFEGLNERKIKKSILQNEYRKKVFTLLKDKMILDITKEAKNSFDKIQPDLNKAKQYLEILTDGKYSDINLELKEITNKDCSLTKKWNELSRGTKEQLYLALKLGYASNYTKDRITLDENGKSALPLIIDDAFVNFDTQRTRQAIKCLIEFSKTNQVLFFTCHNEIMKKHFEQLCSQSKIDLNIINI